MDDVQDLIEELRAARRLPTPKAARRIRRKAGISQARMAQVLGVARSTLARWEAGEMTPRPAQRRRWAEVLAELERECVA